MTGLMQREGGQQQIVRHLAAPGVGEPGAHSGQDAALPIY